jgi:hypothetical protein
LGWGIGVVVHGITGYATDFGQNLLGRLEEGEMNRLRKAAEPGE